MIRNHTQQKLVYFKPRALVLAVRRALPFLVAFSLGAALVGPAAGRSGENAAAFTATQLIRQFTLKNTVAQVSQGMQGHVQEVNGFLRAPAMGVRPSGFPADMGSVPGTVNLPRRDGAGRPLGYCAWDNASASSDANHLAGSGVPNPLAYAVISPGLNGTMETTCANVLATGAGQGDDFVQVTAPAQASSKQFKSAVGTVVELQATPAEEGDVRLVAENNKLYSYLGELWVPVDGSKFADDSVANGAGALAYIAGKVTVADFQATSATITGALAADSATFTNGVTAATFTGNGSGLTDLNAGNINSGILGAAFGGTGVDGSAAAQGSLLIGTGAGFALGAITAGDGIGVLNGAGSITISNTGVLSITGTADQIIASGSNGDVVLSLPQSIATTGTPTFAGMMLNGALAAPSAIFSGDISARRLYLSDSSGGVTTPNLVIGLGAMAAATSGVGANTAVGIGALAANTTGDKNTAIGEGALNANLTGNLNTALGHSALRDNTTGSLNTALGSSSLRFNVSGSNNTAVGDGALYNNLTGDLNTSVGRASMISNINGYNNSALGEAALYNNTSGYENVAVGKHTMMSNTTGFENTAIGLEALWRNSTGTRNVALGRHAGFDNQDGSNNTFLGTSSAPESGSLNFATAIGASSRVSTDNTIVLGRVTDRTVIGATGADGSSNLLQVTGNAGVSGDLVLTASGSGSTLGSKIRFGGVNEQTDPISLGRINASNDNSILQLTLGDNQVDSFGGNGDRFQIALTNGFVGHYFDSNGNAYHAGNLSVGSLSTGRLDIADYTGVAEPNIIIGPGAMLSAQNGSGGNVALGIHVMESNTSGARNTALGSYAMHVNIMGIENTAVGFAALGTNSSGYYNTAVGESALLFNTTGFSNVAMGNSALRNNITGWENIAIGQDALFTNTAGAGNLAFGYESLKFLNSGSSNIGIGYDALENLQSGSRNVAIGNEAGERDGTRTLSFGSDNTFLGAYTGPAAGVNTLNFGTAIGAYAEVSTDNTIVLGRTTDKTVIGATGDDGSGNLLQVTGNARISGTLNVGVFQTERMNIGSNAGGVTHTNIGIGYNTLSAAQSGNGGNLAVGQQVLQNNTTGHYNTGLGIYALSANQTGARNTAVGYSALVANTTGSRNSVVGYRALYSNLTGDYNVAMGYYAMQFSTEGSYNVVLGNFGLGHNTTGHSNSLLGDSAMFNNSTGFENVAVGRYALYNNGAGEGNVAVGYNSTSGLSSGSENTILGRYSMEGLTTGSRNVALGAEAGSRDASRMLTSGSDNTFLGAYSGTAAGVNTLNFGTAIGAYAEVSTNNTIVLGRTIDTTVIGATGVASSGVLLGKKLQVTGDVGITGNFEIGGTFIAPSASFTGAVSAARMNVGTSAGVTNPNIIVGVGAMAGAQSGIGANTAVGALTLQDNSSGWGNTAVGDWAMQKNTTGYGNTAVGDGSLLNNTTGIENVVVGQYALYSSTEGSGNSVVGLSALGGLTSGSENAVLGYYALDNLTSGSRNVALGAEAGSRDASRMLTSGSDNTFLGAYSGPATGVSTLNFATAVGAYAQVGTDNTVVLGRPSHTTVIGATGTALSGALSGNKLQVTGSIGATGNFVLAQSGTGSTLGSQIFFGANFEETDTISLGRINSSVNNSILQLTMGDDSVQDVGGEGDRFQIATTDGNVRHAFDSNGHAYHAGTLTVSRLRVGNYDGGVGDINFAIGFEALAAAQSGDGGNVAVGEHVLEYNTTGAFNTALGNYAMHWNETGSQNTAVGYNALQDNFSGSSNTAIGRHVMYFNSTGSSNTAVGDDALAFNTTGNMNVAMGHYALYVNAEGFENTAIGYDSIERLTSGAENTALGSFALNFLTTGSRNTAIGSESASRDPGFYLTSGSDNSFLGAYSGPASGFNTLNFATAIGAYAEVSTSNTVVLGRTTDRVVIGATGTDGSGNKLQVAGSIKATAFNTSSDRRLKNSITQLDSSSLLSQLKQLNAYHYRFNNDPTGQIRYGVIAQEVASLFPHAVSYDSQGLMAVDYGALGAIAATAVGQLSTQVTALDQQVKTNTENITTLTDRMGKAEGKIDALESWKTQAVGRMDNLQTAIDKNIADIAKNAVAITANTQRIDTLEQVTALLDARTSEHGSLIAVLKAQWSDTFSRADDGQTLVVNAPNLKTSNFSAQQASVGSLYSERLMAEMAKIKALEVDSLLVNSAQARTVRADEMNTGSAQVYAGVGLPALLFAATADGHYTVNTSALDGSYATATVIVNAGQAKIVPVASEGIELMAEGNTVKAIAAGKSIKASWIKMG